MVGIITLRNQAAGASEGTVAFTLAAIKDWTFLLGPGWVVGCALQTQLTRAVRPVHCVVVDWNVRDAA